MLYAVLVQMARVALRWYYSDIETVGAERVPRDEPMLVVANHPNALMDPMLVGTSLPRRLTFTGKATLFANPLLAAFLGAVGMVPLKRASDEAARRAAGGAPDRTRNVDAFRAIISALEARKAVLIFPEGKSHDEPAISALKTGAARLALQAMEAGVRSLVILPVGLVFEDKAEPRTRVLVEVGEPLHMADWHPPAIGFAVDALTTEIDRRLREVTINFASAAAASDILAVSRLLAEGTESPASLGGTPFSGTVGMTRRAGAVSAELERADAALLARADALRARVRSIRESAEAGGIRLGDAGIDTTAGAAATFVVREAAIALFGGPLALWGRVTHWTPLYIARAIARHASRSGADPAMYTVVSGTVLVLTFYLVATALVWRAAGLWWALLFLASLPISAGWDLRMRDRAARAARRVRAFIRFRRDPDFQRVLVGELARAREEALALEVAVTRAGGSAA